MNKMEGWPILGCDFDILKNRPTRAAMRVFDRRTKLLQRERAAANPEIEQYDFLKEEVGLLVLDPTPAQVGYRVSDRVLDVARRMEVGVDLGSGRGWVTRWALCSYYYCLITAIPTNAITPDTDTCCPSL